MAKTFKTNNKFGRKNKEFFSVLYPAADDELERFECCLTGILDGRLYTHYIAYIESRQINIISMYTKKIHT